MTKKKQKDKEMVWEFDIENETHALTNGLGKFKSEINGFLERTEDKKEVNITKLEKALTLLELLAENNEQAQILVARKIREEEKRKD